MLYYKKRNTNDKRLACQRRNVPNLIKAISKDSIKQNVPNFCVTDAEQQKRK